MWIEMVVISTRDVANVHSHLQLTEFTKVFIWRVLSKHICAYHWHLCRDPNEVKRSVAHISWFPDGPKKLAVAYSRLEFQSVAAALTSNTESYIWDIGKKRRIHSFSFFIVKFISHNFIQYSHAECCDVSSFARLWPGLGHFTSNIKGAFVQS